MTRWSFLTLTLLFAGACGGARVPSSAPPAEAADALREGPFRAEDPILGYPGIAERLPAEISALYVMAGLEPLLQRLGIDAGAPELREALRSVRDTFLQSFSIDLFDPAQIKALGIDIRAPVAVALYDTRGNRGAITAEVTNRARLETWMSLVARRAGLADEVVELGEARVWPVSPAGDVVFVLVGSRVWFVLDDEHHQALAVARALAARVPASSLARDPTFQDALERLSFGDHLGFFISRHMVVELSLDHDPQAIARLEGRAPIPRGTAGLRSWIQRKILGGFRAFVLGATITERSIVLKSVTLQEPGGILARLLVNGSVQAPFLAAMSQCVGVVLRLDLDTLFELVGDGLAQGGKSRDLLDVELRKRFSLDLDRDILGVLDGEGVVDVWRSRPSSPTCDRTSLRLSLRDPMHAAEVLDRLAEQPLLSALLHRRGPGLWSLGGPRTPGVRLAIRGTALVFFNGSSPPEEVHDATGEPPAAGLNRDLAALRRPSEVALALDISGRWLRERAAGPRAPAATPPAAPEVMEGSRVPRIERARAELRWRVARAQYIDARLRDLDDERQALAWDAVGDLALRARIEEASLVAYGGIFLAEETVHEAARALLAGLDRLDKEGARLQADRPSNLERIQTLRAEIKSLERPRRRRRGRTRARAR